MGRYFEEFAVGLTITTTERLLTDADVMAFAALTGDTSRLHSDDAYARTTMFGARIAHGALVFSVSVGLTTGTNIVDGTLIAFARVDHLRFTRPVFIGDSVHVVKRVTSVEVAGPGGLVAFDTRVLNQRDELVLAYTDRLIVRRREGAVGARTGVAEASA
jgi:acyl dehydratase